MERASIVMSRDEALFRRGELHSWLEDRLRAAVADVDSYPPEKLLGTELDDLAEYFSTKHSVEDIHLKDRPDDISADEPTEAMIDVFDFGRNVKVRGTINRFYVPFEGDPVLLQLRGSSVSSNYPRAVVADGHLVFTVPQQEPDPEALKHKLQQQLSLVRQYLSGVTPGVSEFNGKLPGLVRQRVEERRAKLLAGKQAIAATGFKLRSRPGAATYAPPVVRRKVTPAPPPVTSSTTPDPTLDDAIYEEILRVIGHAMLTAERSPSVFVGMGEEDIRQIILLFLNAVFEGEAVGEAFNYAGKTDILIRHKGGNLFIAECKFWGGPKSLSDAIDQLLGYTTWRDTKTAVVLLNRDVEFSTVLDKVPDVLRGHGSFVRDVAVEGQGRFRAVLARPADAESHFVVTVLAFDLPR